MTVIWFCFLKQEGRGFGGEPFQDQTSFQTTQRVNTSHHLYHLQSGLRHLSRRLLGSLCEACLLKDHGYLNYCKADFLEKKGFPRSDATSQTPKRGDVWYSCVVYW